MLLHHGRFDIRSACQLTYILVLFKALLSVLSLF